MNSFMREVGRARSFSRDLKHCRIFHLLCNFISTRFLNIISIEVLESTSNVEVKGKLKGNFY